MTASRTALHVSPHPDDEVLGAGATLTILRDGGWRGVNLACSLGRPADEDRRRDELAAALGVLRFESVVADPPVALGAGADHRAAEDRVAALVTEVADRVGAQLIVSPGPEDAHHAHATVGRAVGRAVGGAAAATGTPAPTGQAPPTGQAAATGTAPATGPAGGDGTRRWWAWSLWRDLEQPTLYVPWGDDRLAELSRALACHAGELQRNRYGDVLAARGRLEAVLGGERVFGFGSGPASTQPYADLLTERTWTGGGWRTGPPRLLGTD